MPTVDAPCFLCRATAADTVWSTPDRAFAVPGIYTVVRCRACGFLYQKPRVADAHLAECYPDHYPRHQEPAPRVPLKGSPLRLAAVRWFLGNTLRYPAFHVASPGLSTRLYARRLARRIRWECPPWRGSGRYLDVGCGSGSALGVARALGWKVAGVEVDEAAAAKARRFSDEIYAGDVLEAPFEPGRFDVVTAFHMLEHVPDPVAVIRRMMGWLAPGGLLIVEVPNAGGLGARMFGPAWSGVELPRHLSHFTPETLTRAVEQAGGRMVWCWHGAKPRYFLWSLSIWLRDRGRSRLARFVEWRLVRGALKLGLEVTLPLARWAERGEVIRVGITRRAGP